ncbi:unnamed protein product [Sphagnum jensenii]|uniref:ATP synthase subunit e, mitochondrial n=1 Tax=Sphagnum jensenii TaxID=128206 RepID=A0ABP0WAN4_9BRYO
MVAAAGPYSGSSTLALVARISAVSIGLVYGSMKLAYLKKASLHSSQYQNLKRKAQHKAQGQGHY